MLFENIKNYFKKKSQNQETGLAPEGICPNCWGKQEWEGQFYEHMRAENIAPESDTYNNFIKNVTRKLGEITLKEGSYTCTTSQISYKKS